MLLFRESRLKSIVRYRNALALHPKSEVYVIRQRDFLLERMVWFLSRTKQ